MGERKGQNKYYPPDFDPKKHGNLNKYHGTHALRERARKLDQGILIIRFEMPYNIWCDGCKAHIAMGVRYNAEKTKIGMYFTTPIHQFKMKCHLCDQHFIIKTDPANLDYVIESGAKRKEQRWDMGENEQIVTNERDEIKRLSVDPMFSLEHEKKDKEKVAKLMPTLKELEEVKQEWKDDYRLNSMMRNVLRSEKKTLNEQKKLDKALLDKWHIDIELVKEHEDDVKLASLYKYNTSTDKKDDDEIRMEKRKTLETESIFNETKKSKQLDESTKSSSSTPSSSKSLSLIKVKDLQLSNLRQKISKSIVEKQIVNTGFGFSNNSDNEKKSNLTNLVKLNNKSQKEVPTKQESKSTISKPLLVSNDYGSDESD